MTALLPTDLEIAHAATLRPLVEVAADLGLTEDHLEPWGRDVAKIDLAVLDEPDARHAGRSTSSSRRSPRRRSVRARRRPRWAWPRHSAASGTRAVVALRQPSMGPTFGIKGGAAGGGYSQVVPMERLNLHLTGDFHAVTAAHNLLSAMIDNHLHHGNKLGIDVRNITWRRVLDVNDRALRTVIVGIGAREDGLVRQTGFDITAASEVMVLLTLATSLEDLRLRLGRIVVAYTVEGKSVTADDLQAAGAMAVILQDALKPNLLQTLEGGPAIIHCGPFGNIATGTSSVIADLVGVRGSDYVITEAGFGADMGAERFFNVKCRVSGLAPDAAVLVATVRALKAHSGHWTIKPGKPLPDGLLDESPEEVQAGLPNLRKHIEIIQRFGIQPVVAINAFPTDFDSEHAVIRELCDEMGVRCAVTRHVAEGGAGALELARVVDRGGRGAHRLPLPLPPRDAAGREDRDHRPRDLRRGRHRRRARPRPRRSRSTSGSASATCRSSSPRRTCRSRRTRRARARRPAGGCPCARCARRSAPATSTRSAATCARCPACRSRPTPSASTSPRRASSPACRDGRQRNGPARQRSSAQRSVDPARHRDVVAVVGLGQPEAARDAGPPRSSRRARRTRRARGRRGSRGAAARRAAAPGARSPTMAAEQDATEVAALAAGSTMSRLSPATCSKGKPRSCSHSPMPRSAPAGSRSTQSRLRPARTSSRWRSSAAATASAAPRAGSPPSRRRR